LAQLKKGRQLEHQIMLLVGAVGSGKSTFVDHLSITALPEETRSHTVWLRINLNYVPLSREHAYDWVVEQIISSLLATRPDTDFDALPNLERVYGIELMRFKKGPLSVFEPDSNDYKSRLADELIRLQRDRLVTAQALSRFLCGQTGRLLVVVLDNCDKRSRDEQLLMFQLAQWIQTTFHVLVILPIRDVTYELHRQEPPLDTALKDLVFRIEAPMFAKVLGRRIQLALELMSRGQQDRVLSYTLRNGVRVEYPASEQGVYLASILRSVYEHDRFVRRIIAGLGNLCTGRPNEVQGGPIDG
jgi:hypothetical protein